MKKIITICFAILFGSLINCQTYKKLNDPSITAQHKRMVFESWGDFRPNPKYNFLGIQTNFAYATVWGMWAPSRNKRYKNGEDIRPLKPTGTETQRLISVELQRKEAEKIKTNADSIHKRKTHDFAHWTSLTVDADPLWLLYYKRMLSPLNNFPSEPKNHLDWKIDNKENYDLLVSTGEINQLKEQLDILKDKYHTSRTVDMPRGKRFLMYHETLIGWRKLVQNIERHNNKSTLILDYRTIFNKYKTEIFKSNKKLDDDKIMLEILEKHKHQF